MREQWGDFRLAIGLLTIFPAAGVETDLKRQGRSMAFFPAVGLVLGLALVILNWALAPFIPRAVLDCLLVLILIAATGGLHLDGIADLLDGLAGGKDREGTLRIMKDSRVGAMGVVGLVMILLLKYLSLYNVPAEVKSGALIFMPAAGRWIQVILAGFCRRVRSGGEEEDFTDHSGERETLIATATLIVAALILFGMKAFFLLLLLGLAAIALIRYFEARLGGVTGDVLGAATEVMEVLTLILLLAAYTT